MSSAQAGFASTVERFLRWVRGDSEPVWRRALTMQAASLWVVLALGLLLGLLTTRTPAPADERVASEAFSAARAFRHVQAIGRAAHPTGSPEAERVRRYVFDRFTDLGLHAEIHAAEAAETRKWDGSLAAAALQNVVGVLSGSDPQAPALLVMAHSDSVPNSPGAGDDGVGVAVLLETARSLAVQGPHRRTVIFLVTDGEELGLMGARAFFDRDPLRLNVGAVVNMDARGDAGRTAMFQLGPRSGGLLRLYGQAAAAPYANSLTALLFKILPNDTDFTVALGADKPGLNFAFIGDQLAYHTPLATPAHLSLGALQSMGGQVLPTVRALADAETLPEDDAPAAYSDLFGQVLLPLPLWALALCWIIAAGAAGFAGWRGWRARLFGRNEVLCGAGVALLCLLSAALILTTAGALLGGGYLRQYALVARYHALLAGCGLLALATALVVIAAAARARGWRWGAGLAVLAGLLAQAGGWNSPVLVLAILVISLVWATLRRRTGAWALWIGALAIGTGLSLVLLVAAPGATPLVLGSTLLGALAAAAVFGAGAREGWAKAALWIAGALGVVAIGWLCGWISGLFVAVGASLPAVLAPFALLALMAVAPFARWWAGRTSAPWTILGMALTGTAILFFVGLAPPSKARPSPSLALAVIEDGRPPLLVSSAPSLDPWTRRLLPRPVHTPLPPVYERPVWSGPAPGGSRARKPMMEAVRVDDRVILHLLPDGVPRRLTLWLRSDQALADPRLDARKVAWPLKAGRWSRLAFDAPPPEGFAVSFAAPQAATLDLVAGQLNDGWPPGPPPPPAPPMGLMPFSDSGSTLSLTRARLRPVEAAIPKLDADAAAVVH